MSNVDYKEKYNNLKKQFDVFTYAVSHDLNAPLRHVREFTKILLGEIGDNVTESQQEAAHFINKATEQAEAMLGGLLSYSRLNTAQKSFGLFNVECLFAYAKTNCQPLIKERKAKVYFSENNPEIYADREKLNNLVVYLLENAIKFCDKKTLPEIHCDIAEENNGYILSIKDNGKGIDKKYFEDIFCIFKQLDPESAGVGLGLALSQKITELHNGKIWLTSQPGKGSIFYVFLPNAPKGV